VQAVELQDSPAGLRPRVILGVRRQTTEALGSAQEQPLFAALNSPCRRTMARLPIVDEVIR